MTDDLKKLWEKVDARNGPQRMETEAEHIARDMREGNFPKRSDPIQVPVNQTPATPTPNHARAVFEEMNRDPGKFYPMETCALAVRII
mgnify:FL=1